MSKPAASIVIVSYRRPKELERALSALMYQSVVNIEIIVVADRPPLINHRFEAPVKFIEIRESNIARARNLGVLDSEAPIVVFCDDDAIPDPYWLERLIEPFYSDKKIAACGGFVRGRNGFSYQWRGVGFYKNGQDFKIDIDENKPWTVFEPNPDQYVKTIGVNCAFRKSALHKIGGFDEGFHYYLDDTDVNKRLQDAGFSTAIVPRAQLIHNYLQNRGRDSNRVPQSLYDLGASTNLFLRKHCEEALEINLERFYRDQDIRLRKYFHLGLVTPRQKRRLLRDLSNGLVSGALRKPNAPLKPVRSTPLRSLQKQNLLFAMTEKRPTQVAGRPHMPVYVRRSYTAYAARMGFSRAGFWWVSGGRFGRILRKGPFWRYRSRAGYRRELQSILDPNFEVTNNSA